MNNKLIIALIPLIFLSFSCDLNTEQEVTIEIDPCITAEQLECQCDRTTCDEQYECECSIEYSLLESENCHVAECLCECIDLE